MSKNILDKVIVEGFWGDKTITLDFHDDTNFLIGVNGSGKTTFINLIAAALTCDVITLMDTDFKKNSNNLKAT